MNTFIVEMILTLVEMHTNEISITPDHLFEVEIIGIKFINCLVREFEMCQDLHKGVEYDVEFEECVFHSFQLCQKENMLPSDHPVFYIASQCIKSCMEKRLTELFRLEACFINCYEEWVSK